MFERVHSCFDRCRSAFGVLGMHRDPAAHGVHGGHGLAQDIGRQRVVPEPPVSDQLRPAGPRRLRSGQPRQFCRIRALPPAVEELAVLGDPRSGVHRPRNIGITAEPVRRVAGQARRADHRDSRGHMLSQVLTQQLLIQRLAGALRTGMGVRVNQAGQQPALARQFRARDRIGGPPIPVSVQVNSLSAGKRDPPDPQNRHIVQIAMMTGFSGGAGPALPGLGVLPAGLVLGRLVPRIAEVDPGRGQVHALLLQRLAHQPVGEAL